MALALGINALLIIVLLGIGKFAPGKHQPSNAIVVDLVRGAETKAREMSPAKKEVAQQKVHPLQSKPLPKPPPIVIPSKPTISQPHSSPWIEMSHDDLAAADISNLPKASAGEGGDSDAVGRAPNGDVLYAAEWARRPTNAELGGYLPAGAPDGYGLVACKTFPNDRVDDCVELESSPAGSHLARAVRQAAWQFKVRPPRKNGKPLIGAWVRIEIDYEHYGSAAGR
jgi:periplasmic protein TonB